MMVDLPKRKKNIASLWKVSPGSPNDSFHYWRLSVRFPLLQKLPSESATRVWYCTPADIATIVLSALRIVSTWEGHCAIQSTLDTEVTISSSSLWERLRSSWMMGYSFGQSCLSHFHTSRSELRAQLGRCNSQSRFSR